MIYGMHELTWEDVWSGYIYNVNFVYLIFPFFHFCNRRLCLLLNLCVLFDKTTSPCKKCALREEARRKTFDSMSSSAVIKKTHTSFRKLPQTIFPCDNFALYILGSRISANTLWHRPYTLFLPFNKFDLQFLEHSYYDILVTALIQ